MENTSENKAKVKWDVWIGPAGMLGCLYLLIRFLSSPGGFSTKTLVPVTSAGQVPDVSYQLTGAGVASICVGIALMLFFLQSLRVWARYYLNRKLIISYLFFAIIPLCTLLVISVMGTRLWIGISNANAIDGTMGIFARDLEGFADSIQQNLTEGIENNKMVTGKKYLDKIISDSRRQKFVGYQYAQLGDILVNVYYLDQQSGGRNLFLIRSADGADDDDLEPGERSRNEGSMYNENRDAEDFESVLPPWMDEKTEHLGIITRGDKMYIQHFSLTPQITGKIIVVASLAIDYDFLKRIQELQEGSITVEHVDGAWSYDYPNTKDSWLWRYILRPLKSTWHLQALDWATGNYNHVSNISFEISPDALMEALNKSNRLHFFHQEQKSFQFQIILYLTLLLWLGICIAYIFGFYLVSYITRSLNLIAWGHENVAMGKLDYRLPYLGKDQIGAMGRSFNSMVGNIESLLDQVTETQKYQEELRIARDIQMSLLPDLDTIPWCKNIAASCIPAREVGGDYYEVVRCEDGQIGIFIADVSGKGTSAAFYMAELKGVLIALRHLWNDPAELMLGMNEILHPALQNNVFISAAYLLLNPADSSGRLARAGHCPAIHLTRSGQTRDIMPPGIAIGLAKNQVFGKIIKVAHFDMEPGDKIVLFTDGLDEMSFHDEMYGIDRLKEIMSANATDGARQLKDTILQDVLGFLSSGEQNDDLTLVVAGLDESSTPGEDEAVPQQEDAAPDQGEPASQKQEDTAPDQGEAASQKQEDTAPEQGEAAPEQGEPAPEQGEPASPQQES